MSSELQHQCVSVHRRAVMAARSWRNNSVGDRLVLLKKLRREMALRASDIAELIQREDLALSLSAELLPTLDAMKFLENESEKLLRPRRLGVRGRPLWMGTVDSEVHYEPHGTILIIAPSNYPFLLSAALAFQALVAGNAVVIKPAENESASLELLLEIMDEVGFPPDIIQLLATSVESSKVAVEHGFDKVIFTGSAETGRKVLASQAAKLKPSVVELSGNDAAVILEGADIDRVAKLIAYGLCLNDGCTCISPRRLFVANSVLHDFVHALSAELIGAEEVMLGEAAKQRVNLTINQSLSAGASLSVGGFSETGAFSPCVLTDIEVAMPFCSEDLFAPVCGVIGYDDVSQLAELINASPYALGASVYGPNEQAITLAGKLDVGCITVNDLIVPTADPRVPFGGYKQSGFGTTRGREGLMEMVRAKTVLIRRGKFLGQLDTPITSHTSLIGNYIKMSHCSSWADRVRASMEFMKAWKNQTKK